MLYVYSINRIVVCYMAYIHIQHITLDWSWNLISFNQVTFDLTDRYGMTSPTLVAMIAKLQPQAYQLFRIRWETPAIWPTLPFSCIYPLIHLHTADELSSKKKHISLSYWIMYGLLRLMNIWANKYSPLLSSLKLFHTDNCLHIAVEAFANNNFIS